MYFKKVHDIVLFGLKQLMYVFFSEMCNKHSLTVTKTNVTKNKKKYVLCSKQFLHITITSKMLLPQYCNFLD